jgi:hypothetical protein
MLQEAKNYLEEQLYPFTITHLITFILFTAISYYVTEYILKLRLLKWIYIATLIVLIANLYKVGDNKKAAKDIFKLATL